MMILPLPITSCICTCMYITAYIMEVHSSIRGDKHEFCLVVIKLKHARSCPSIDITYT